MSYVVHYTSRVRCGQCGEQVREDAVVALGRLWHPGHFLCYICRNPLQQTYHEEKEKAYCSPCFTRKFHPKCSGCGQILIDTFMTAVGKYWHQGCFLCCSCDQNFPVGEEFLVIQDLPYHRGCHWQKRLEDENKVEDSNPTVIHSTTKK